MMDTSKGKVPTDMDINTHIIRHISGEKYAARVYAFQSFESDIISVAGPFNPSTDSLFNMLNAPYSTIDAEWMMTEIIKGRATIIETHNVGHQK